MEFLLDIVKIIFISFIVFSYILVPLFIFINLAFKSIKKLMVSDNDIKPIPSTNKLKNTSNPIPSTNEVIKMLNSYNQKSKNDSKQKSKEQILKEENDKQKYEELQRIRKEDRKKVLDASKKRFEENKNKKN